MRQAKILYKDEEAGLLTQHDDGSFTFDYLDSWVVDNEKQDISLTLPKRKQTYHSRFLFPFFYNMLPEGANRQVVCIYHRIDSDDYFGLLLTSASLDGIGAVRVVQMDAP